MDTVAYIIRHGETDNNKAHRFIGFTDKPLNQRGLEQAACLTEPMSKIPLTAIYSSPFLRTMQTAEAVRGNRRLPILRNEGLCEINCGLWEGLNREEIEAQWPGMIKYWQEEPSKLHMPEGESFEQVQQRGTEAFKEIIAANHGGHVAIVSHMLTIQLIICKLFDIPIDDVWRLYRLENTSVTKMRIKDTGEFSIEKWGEDGHLAESLKNTYVKIAGFKPTDFAAKYGIEYLQGTVHQFPA